jgi:hypothetical protein
MALGGVRLESSGNHLGVVGTDLDLTDCPVVDWNERALRFNPSLGAEPMDEWIGYRLSGDHLVALAAEVTSPR